MKNHAIILFLLISLFGACKKEKLPVAEFEFTGGGCTAPCNILFENKSENANSYLWEFGDGTNSTEVNPTKTYNTGGTYTVTLTATNEDGSHSVTESILIQNSTQSQLPSANFTISNNGCVSPCTVSFNNTSSNSNSYQWNFGDGGNSSATNPSHQYYQGGSYTVTLTATNASGTDQFQQTVNIQGGYTKVRITRVTVLSFPPNDDNGSSWDNNPLTGNYLADVYYKLTLADNTVLLNGGSSNRMEDADPNGDFYWNINYLYSDLGSNLYVDLFDFDSSTADDYIGWTGPWSFSTYTTYPSTKTITANGISVRLNLQWE